MQMTREVHDLVLTKTMERTRTDSSMAGNIERLLQSVNEKGLLISGWTIQENPIGTGGSESMYSDDPNAEGGVSWSRSGDSVTGFVYEMYLNVVFEHETRKPNEDQLASILHKIATRAYGHNFGRWTLAFVDGNEYVKPHESELYVSVKGDDISYADVIIPDDFEKWFTHLYGLDYKIGRIKSALEAGVDSDWANRFNCALIGPPGCGKSDICQTLRRMLGNEAVWELDATATTSAGAIKALAERDVLPRIIVIEELEKAREDAAQFLLSILDIRSEIRKVTARGKVETETKLFAVATVNNKDLFLRMSSGALASRFPHKIHFQRPTREQLGMILVREVDKVEGDRSWIRPTLDYCEKSISADGEQGITDPRQVIALCLSGRNLWIPQPGEDISEYEKMLVDTAEPEILGRW